MKLTLANDQRQISSVTTNLQDEGFRSNNSLPKNHILSEGAQLFFVVLSKKHPSRSFRKVFSSIENYHFCWKPWKKLLATKIDLIYIYMYIIYIYIIIIVIIVILYLIYIYIYMYISCLFSLSQKVSFRFPPSTNQPTGVPFFPLTPRCPFCWGRCFRQHRLCWMPWESQRQFWNRSAPQWVDASPIHPEVRQFLRN